MKRFFAFLFFNLFVFVSLKAQDKNIAFVGDSISTGAVAHPDLNFDAEKLWQIFRGKHTLRLEDFSDLAVKEDLPTRLWPSLREYIGSLEWASLGASFSFSQKYLDTSAYAWGNLLAKNLGYAGNQTLIAAQDGARIQSATRQIDRVLATNHGVLPHQLFIFYSGNDLCGPAIDYLTTKEEFSDALQSALNYALRNGKPHPLGTKIYILSYLGILQLTGANTILEKKVTAHGKEMTCRELANYNDGYILTSEFITENPEAFYFFRFFPSNPATMCPTVFEKNMDFDKTNQRITLANRIQSFRTAAKEILNDAKNQWQKKAPNVDWYFVEAPANVIFAPEHIANDCFHLSKAGQRYLSEMIYQELNTQL